MAVLFHRMMNWLVELVQDRFIYKHSFVFCRRLLAGVRLAVVSYLLVLRPRFSFSSGPAGLLSPLQTTRSDNLICAGLLGVHQNGGRATEMLAGLRRHHPYIKEEVLLLSN